MMMMNNRSLWGRRSSCPRGSGVLVTQSRYRVSCVFGFNSAVVCTCVCVWAHTVCFWCERRVESVWNGVKNGAKILLFGRKTQEKSYNCWMSDSGSLGAQSIGPADVQSKLSVFRIHVAACILFCRRLILHLGWLTGRLSFIHHYCALWMLTLSRRLRHRSRQSGTLWKT